MRRITTIARRRRRGLSLIEVAISTLLVGVLGVASLQAVGAALRNHADLMQETKSLHWAEDLMGEIQQQSYREPLSAPRFGVESGEPSSGPRTTWDDVDDYDDWTESPLRNKDGTVVPDTTGWRRWVEVKHVAPNNLATVLPDGNDQGVKRITVHVSRDGTTLGTLVVFQTKSWNRMLPEPRNDQTTGHRPRGSRRPRR
jgi:MSHA pilin protein MshD